MTIRELITKLEELCARGKRRGLVTTDEKRQRAEDELIILIERAADEARIDGLERELERYKSAVVADAFRIGQLEAENQRLQGTVARYRWRPIAEMHEDYGKCMLINVNDSDAVAYGNNLNYWFEPSDWTHFAQLPEITIEEAQRLRQQTGK